MPRKLRIPRNRRAHNSRVKDHAEDRKDDAKQQIDGHPLQGNVFRADVDGRKHHGANQQDE